MRQPSKNFPQGWMWIVLMAALAAIHTTDAFGSSLVYKNFVVRYDRGWDILCEPYVVKKNDWVLKIFKQKGEIAHKDFRDFLGIFKRLNPHIKDTDLIRPGQGIDIPLRKIEHGSMPGQELGVVTIPFVSLAEVTEVVKQYSHRYTVKKGDTISKLLASKYGRYGTKSYGEGIKLLKAANPQVTDVNKIYAGQKLYLPDPAIREKSWYTAIYDDQGNLREKMDQSQAPETGQEKPAAIPKPLPPKPSRKPAAPFEGKLAEAAQFVGGQLQAKGTYYLPREGESDFELDLSKHPTLELGKGPKLIFTPDNTIMEMDKDAFQSNWPEMKPVSVEKSASTEQYIAAIFEALEKQGEPTEELTFENQGVRVAVRAKWVRAGDQGRQLCITPIAAPDQQTPESIRRYIEQNGIVIKEILPGGATIEAGPGNLKRHTIKNILAIPPQTSQREFVVTMAKTLGLGYVPNTSITFPYAGIQVQAFANLLSTKSGQEALVDFGDLYGDAVTAIGQSGLKVVQITPEESYDSIVQKLFSALSINFEQHPTLLAAQRSAEYNIAITINGLLYANDENQRVLLTGADLHSAVTDMLSNRGIDVVVW